MSAAVCLFIPLQRPAVRWYAFILIKRVKIASDGLCVVNQQAKPTKQSKQAKQSQEIKESKQSMQSKQSKHVLYIC